MPRIAACLIWLVLGAAVLAPHPQAHAGAISLPDRMPRDPVALSEETQSKAAELAVIIDQVRSFPKLATSEATTGKRRALVIGNDNYSELTKLDAAVNDSVTIGIALDELGFEVVQLKDVDVRSFDKALDSFYKSLRPGDVAFFSFAGHGISVDGRNFLLPTDMPAMTDISARLVERYSVDAARIVDEVKARGIELAFFVLDACRNNPFPQQDIRSAVSLGGLVDMQPRDGSFILYSAGAGETALDSLGGNDAEQTSVFTRKFWPILTTPGLPIVEIAKRTQIEVAALAATVRHKQAPAYYDEIVGQFYFQPPKPTLYGIAVGIDRYVGHPIRGAVNDAEMIARALEAQGAAEVTRIYNEDARLAFLEYAWRSTLAKANPGDTITLTYSGTGYQRPAPQESGEKDMMDELLLLWGPEPINAEIRPSALEKRLLTDDMLTGWMNDAAKKNVNVILLVDGCHGGGLLDREFANVSFIGASDEDETIGEYQLVGRYHGAASYAFASGLDGAADFNSDGFISQRELFGYVAQDVLKIAKGRQTAQFLPKLDESQAALALVQIPADFETRKAALETPWPDTDGNVR
jgi:hypothetical protein